MTHTLPEVPEGRATDYGPGAFFAADPDGDGRDGILVATYQGATLIDGDRRVEIGRDPAPATDEGEECMPEEYLRARPAGAADFDADGDDELVLHRGPGLSFGLYGEYPTHWWITEGTGSDDMTSFATTSFAADEARARRCERCRSPGSPGSRSAGIPERLWRAGRCGDRFAGDLCDPGEGVCARR
ncbi:hypothetical protein [Streptomyces sp. RKND-216]|uniref:hypothetical protein n=1 Tax=Streptomyces sp. RKND-216 TaxID=2562581 RepID=UPI001B34889F|nr:hypothetical protein [Streptomyces sp. RKND-216]